MVFFFEVVFIDRGVHRELSAKEIGQELKKQSDLGSLWARGERRSKKKKEKEEEGIGPETFGPRKREER